MMIIVAITAAVVAAAVAARKVVVAEVAIAIAVAVVVTIDRRNHNGHWSHQGHLMVGNVVVYLVLALRKRSKRYYPLVYPILSYLYAFHFGYFSPWLLFSLITYMVLILCFLYSHTIFSPADSLFHLH